MRGTVLRLAAAAALLCAGVPAWSLDLAEAWRLAYERDATIRAARAQAEAGREKLPQARAQFFPNISLGAARYRNNLDSTSPDFLGRPVTSHSVYESGNETLTIRQPLYRKALAAGLRQAEALVADANATLEREEQSLVMRVTQAYFEALLAEEQLRLIQAGKRAYAAQVEAATRALRAGVGTRTDIEEAQARYDMAVAQEVQARSGIVITRRQLQSLVQQPFDQLAQLDVSRVRLAAPAPDNVELWTALAEDNSPELRAARAQVDAARQEIEKARAQHLPTLDAIAQVSRSGSENVTRPDSRYVNRQIGVQLQVPLYQGGYVSSQVREAHAILERAQAKLEELRRDLSVRVHREFHGAMDGVLRVRALEQAVRSAEQLVQSSRRSFEAGARTRIDILNAEQQVGQAQRDLAQARLAFMLANVRLKALTGGLKAENIDEMNRWLQH